jgi:hypothetical protein
VRIAQAGTVAVTMREMLGVAAIVVIALLLRLTGVTSFPLEEDELYTLIESTELFDTRLQPGIEARPLYYLLQHALFAIVPPGTAALRVMPIVFGTLGVFVTWLLGRAVLGRTASIVAAVLVAASPWHVFASGMARYWALVYLLSALALLLLVRAYERDRAGAYLAALVVFVLGTLTHPTFVFPMLGVVLGLTLVSREGRVGWHWPTRRAWGWLWGPYIAALVTEFLVLRMTGNEGAVRNWGGRGLGATLRLLPAMIEWMTPVLFTAGALGAIALLFSRDARERRWGAIATLGVLGTMSILMAASLVTDTYADYAIAMLPLVFVSAGGLVRMGASAARTLVRRPFAWVSTAVLLAGILPATVSHLRDGTRFDQRPIFQRIERERPDLMVVTAPIVVQRMYAPRLRARELKGSAPRLDSLLLAERDMWVVASHTRHATMADADGRLVPWLQDHCRLRLVHERLRLDYRRYRVELWRCGDDNVRPEGGTSAGTAPAS